MMRKTSSSTLSGRAGLLALFVATQGGCANVVVDFGAHDDFRGNPQAARVVLEAAFAQSPKREPRGDKPDSQQTDEEAADSQPATTQPVESRLPYTSPYVLADAPEFWEAEFYGPPAEGLVGEQRSGDVLRAVAVAPTGPLLVGPPGLTAPPPAFGRLIVGTPGLQRGTAAGLGQQSAVNNIFLPRANSLATGCLALHNAGFSSNLCPNHSRH